MVHEHGQRQEVRHIDVEALRLKMSLHKRCDSGSISANELANVAIGGIPLGTTDDLIALK